MIKFLDLPGQYESIRPEIDAAIASTIRDASFVAGPAAERFEAAFAAYQQVAHCVGVGNGTDAIEIALEALALPRGSDVLVPANSFIASAEAVTRSGHRVVFVDVDPRTQLIDVDDAARRCTPSTRAVIAVHLYGQPCDMDAVGTLAAARGLAVIEDAAQAHGAEWRGRRVGGLGTIGTFSFYPGKNLGAYGDAGAIVTNDPVLARRCRMVANHGRIAKYDHEFEGRNSRLDGMQAAVLEVKLRHLDRWTARRITIADRYREALTGVPGLTLPTVLEGARHVFHLFVVRCDQRDALAQALADEGIQTGIHYPVALPRLQAYAYLGLADAPLSACRDDRRVLSLPMGEHLTDAEVDRVIAAVRTFFRQ